MFRIQSKITRHAKRQGKETYNQTYNQEKIQSIETGPEMTEVMELGHKNIKIYFLHVQGGKRKHEHDAERSGRYF